MQGKSDMQHLMSNSNSSSMPNAMHAADDSATGFSESSQDGMSTSMGGLNESNDNSTAGASFLGENSSDAQFPDAALRSGRDKDGLAHNKRPKI